MGRVVETVECHLCGRHVSEKIIVKMSVYDANFNPKYRKNMCNSCFNDIERYIKYENFPENRADDYDRIQAAKKALKKDHAK